MIHKKILITLLALTAFNCTTVLADKLDQMISPVTNPVIFEDPRHSSEIRPIFVHHEIDDKFVTEGGDAQVYALQARFKVTEDFSLIAVKDGYVDLNPNAVVPSDHGFANIALGGKYSFYRAEDSIATLGLTYEIPMGDKEVLQGEGDGLFNPFISVGHTVDNWNFIAHSGFRTRVANEDSSFYDLNLHASYKIENFYPLIEFGLNHVMQAGKRLPIPDEGQDFFNLGSSAAAGENILSMAAGARYRISESVDIGAAYQFPLDSGEGSRILDYRVTGDLIVRFN